MAAALAAARPHQLFWRRLSQSRVFGDGPPVRGNSRSAHRLLLARRRRGVNAVGMRSRRLEKTTAASLLPTGARGPFVRCRRLERAAGDGGARLGAQAETASLSVRIRRLGRA